MSLRDQLQSIYDKKGTLTPQVVVDTARPKTHPLHDRFDWNDKTAGEAWRRVQAQELIRSVKIVYREATEKEPQARVRAWQAVRTEEGHAYKPSEEVRADPFLRDLVLRDMEREWRALYRRYGHFKEFSDLVRETVEAAA